MPGITINVHPDPDAVIQPETNYFNIRADKNYRPDEVADKLRLSSRQVYRYLNDPENPMPSVKLSRTKRGNIVINGKLLIDWLKSREKEPWNE